MLRMVPSRIQLSKVESEICNLVKDFCTHYNGQNTGQEPLVARITGGWVRDKLLGNNSNDLDIAINSMTGEQFAEKLNCFLKDHGLETHSLHKIDKNPSKSKHLETCTTKLFDLPVDFVNLRSEEYTTESRIPKVEFGTPQEDAMRRDATLNAMFYNITEDKIEDFTGFGFQDLESGILRTPLPPLKTFLDDPLRILRLIRFATRFSFHIERDTYEAMRNEKIHSSFENKISRERVYTELHKTLLCENPFYALDLIQGASLSKVIFDTSHTTCETQPIYAKLDKHLKHIVDTIPSILQSDLSLNKCYRSNQETYILSLVLAGFKNMKGPDPAKPKKLIPLASVIAKESIKYPHLESEAIGICVDSRDKYVELIRNYRSMKRSEVGRGLRNLKNHWELVHFVNLSLDFLNTGGTDAQSYREFYEFVQDQNLKDVHELKHLINGKELAGILGKKPGPWMSEALEKLMVWQLDHPDKSKEDFISNIYTILNDEVN